MRVMAATLLLTLNSVFGCATSPAERLAAAQEESLRAFHEHSEALRREFSPENIRAREIAEAEADIKSGKLALRTGGMPGTHFRFRRYVYRTRIGAKLVPTGCVIFDHENIAYNERMKTEIARRFGTEALDQADAEVECRYLLFKQGVADAGEDEEKLIAQARRTDRELGD